VSALVCTSSVARRRVLLAEDALLLALPLACLALRPASPIWWALAAGAIAALAWNVCTLHFPREVRCDVAGITLRAYGREHRFAWAGAQITVRRFLVRDRVLLRIGPAGAARGRYWLTDALDGYPALVRELEARAHGRHP
jgi:hypothetical protein